MVKHTEGAGGVGLFALLEGLPEAVAVVGLSVPVGVDGFLNLEPFGEEKEGQEEFLYVVGVNGDNQ